MKAYTKKLDNGLTVIAVPIEDNPTVTSLVMVEAGTRFENKENNGISHFLEHMCFKGTEKRPSALAVSQELDGLGAESNAFTSHEYTGYYAKSGSEKLSDIFDVVADMYLNPIFPEEEIEKEKGVILEEINMNRDMPNRYVHEVFRELVYGDQPAGWSTLGTKENISNMTRDDFITYRSKHYQPEATTVVIAGGVDKDAAFEVAEEKFGGVPRKEKEDERSVEISQQHPQVKVSIKDSDQAHLALGFRSVDTHDASVYPLEVAGALLGRGMSSRLFQRLRGEMGVCYYVRNYTGYYTDTGLFNIATGVDTSRVQEVVKAIIEEIKKLKEEDIPKEELRKAKEYLAGNELMSYESSDELAMYYGELSTLEKNFQTPKEYTNKIRAVDLDTLQEALEEVFTEERLNLALVGPEQNTEALQDILTLE